MMGIQQRPRRCSRLLGCDRRDISSVAPGAAQTRAKLFGEATPLAAFGRSTRTIVPTRSAGRQVLRPYFSSADSLFSSACSVLRLAPFRPGEGCVAAYPVAVTRCQSLRPGDADHEMVRMEVAAGGGPDLFRRDRGNIGWVRPGRGGRKMVFSRIEQ